MVRVIDEEALAQARRDLIAACQYVIRNRDSVIRGDEGEVRVTVSVMPHCMPKVEISRDVLVDGTGQ